MPSLCSSSARQYKLRKLTNVRLQLKKKRLEPGIILNSAEGLFRFFATRHAKKIKSGKKRLTGIEDDSLSALASKPFVQTMKQISNLKKKMTHGKKSGSLVVKKQNQPQQNGQQAKKKSKSQLVKSLPDVEAQIKSKLNVNERPVRKKKKTKKYENYERNGKSPEPEVKPETNLLLALGLTPVKKEKSEENSRKAK